MATTFFVIDTSYLVHVFEIPKRKDIAATEIISSKISAAEKSPSRIFIPFPVLYELANQIALISEPKIRDNSAKAFLDWVKGIQNGSTTYIVPNTGNTLLNLSELFQHCTDFACKYAPLGVGLSDSTIVYEANRLKSRYATLGYSVHIWTRDKRLKALEPDAEPNPFI